ncbi:MAG: hypothetical protein WKG07_39540 [Hymenobacter sp.]
MVAVVQHGAHQVRALLARVGALPASRARFQTTSRPVVWPAVSARRSSLPPSRGPGHSARRGRRAGRSRGGLLMVAKEMRDFFRHLLDGRHG